MVRLLWLLIIFVTMATSASQQCKDAAYSMRGKYLKGHVISSGSAADIGDCLVKCSNEPRCTSINFRFTGRFCEINDADRFTHPWDYGPGSRWYIYAYSDYPVKPKFKEYNMTPSWLKAHASDIDSSHSITDHQITFSAVSLDYAVLLKVPLVAAGELSDETPLTVEITVGNDVSIGQSQDSDPTYGLSDGTNFTGFKTHDVGNYDTTAPCHGLEGMSGASLSARVNTDPRNVSMPSDRFFPEEFIITMKLDKKWGSCFTAHDGGFTKTTQYSKQLKLSQGLSLEVYQNKKHERIGIKYIKVTIRKTDY